MSSIVESVAPRPFTYDPSGSAPPAAPQPDVSWSLATRVAFRFCAIYVGLYVLSTQMLQALLPIPHLPVPNFGVIPPMRSVFYWIGLHLFGMAHAPSPQMTGSGDKAFDWLQAASLLVIAAAGTLIWSLIARRAQHHARAYRAFRAFLRLSVATTFLAYGFAKVIPQQMPPHQLRLLVEPFGNFSPMGVLWYSVGASPAYEIATGCAEVLGGLLLFLPATTIVGALVCLMDATMIFLLNMTYDVPVKLFSFHLILMSLFLLAPNARRLLDLFILHRSASLRAEPRVLRGITGHRWLVVATAIYGVLMFGLNVQNGIRSWHRFGAGAPKSPLYGIWDVKEIAIDGVARPVLNGDTTLVKRVIFQQTTAAAVQMMNDAMRRFGATVDTTRKQLTLLPSGSDAITLSPLSYQRPDHEHLLIDGMIDGRMTHLALQFRDPDSFLQRSRGFHWVQELPFNR